MASAVRVLCLALVATAPVAAQAPVPLDTLRAGTASRLVAGAAAATRSIDVLDRAAIDALPARSVTDVLARALGVDLQPRSPAQADVAIRGSSFEQVLVMVDGIPVNDDQTGHFHLDLAVPLDAVERIEVLRGPASALFGGSAVGGVINVVTRRATRELVARTQAGSFGSIAAALDAGSSWPGGTVRASVEHDRSDGHREGTDHRLSQARVALDVPVARGTLRADGGFAARDFGANWFYAPFDSYEETRAATAALSWRRAGAALSVEPRLSFRRHEDDFILRRHDPAFYRNVHASRQHGGELVARWLPARSLRLAAGGDAVRSTLESTNLGARAEIRFAAFAEVAAGDVAGTLLTAGLRLDHHTTFGSFLSPSVAFGYRPARGVRVRASAGGGYRPPSWTERYYRDPANIGDPDLDAERFWTGEIGLDLALATPVRFAVAAFIRRADDLIDWGRPAGSTPQTPWRTMNIEQATFRGAESALVLTAAPWHVTARAALLDFDAEEAGGTESKYALRPLTRSFSLELGLRTGRLPAVTIRGSHSVRPAANAAAPDDGWTLIDARVQHGWRALTLFADVTNLADEAYQDVSAQPAPGRAFAVGVRLRR